MNFEFKRTEVEIKIYGEAYKINMPTEDQVLSLQEKIEESKEDPIGILKVRRDFLVSLGIPEDAIKKMEFKHVTQLSEGLLGDIGKKD